MSDNFRQGMYALIVVALAAWFVGWAGGHDAHRGDDLPPDVAAALEDARDGKIGEPEAGAPPKELRPGMAWEVTGAGTSGYNGVYEEDGTYNGQPAYTNGTRWLWYSTLGIPAWWLSETKGDSIAVYTGEPYKALPGGTWSPILPDDAPAPTVTTEYVPPPAPPTPPDPDDTTTKRTGWIGGPLSPTLFPCQTVKPARFVGTDANEYVAFVGRTSIVLYCVDTDTWMALRGRNLSQSFRNRWPIYNDIWHPAGPHPCLLHAGDGETLWYVTMCGYAAQNFPLSAYPLTLDIGSLGYTMGSLFEPGMVLATDLAVDDANTAWFVTDDYKLYSWDLSGASASLVHDWSTGRTVHGAHAGARFWYSGTAGEFFRTHNPYYGRSPDYIHRVSSSVYEYMGESVPIACVSYDHDSPRNLTYGMPGGAYSTWRSTWRYRPGAGDAWQGAGISNATDYVWVLRGDVMMLAGVNGTSSV